MASHSTKTARDAPLTPEDAAAPIGPLSGILSIPSQWTTEQKLRLDLRAINSENGLIYDESMENRYRIKGVQLIDEVRRILKLPVRTFDTAATYYHKFRIRHPSSEYNYEDAALACLFVACKSEDTIKKSKEILCVAHNLRFPQDQRAPDDKIFETNSKYTIGLERHVLETIGFDFREQYPQELLVKVIKHLFGKNVQGKAFYHTAYDMSMDVFKTFATIKHVPFTLVMAIVDLTSRITGYGRDNVTELHMEEWHTSRSCVSEVVLDLLDLYTQHPRATKVQCDLARITDIKIEVNKLAEREGISRYQGACDSCADEAPAPVRHPVTPGSGSATSPTGAPMPGMASFLSSMGARRGKGTDGTIRYVFNAEEARREKKIEQEHFADEWEDYEEEVEEVVPPEQPRSEWNPGRDSRGRGASQRSSHRYSGHHDRHKGRKSNYFH